MSVEIPTELRNALRVLINEGVGDHACVVGEHVLAETHTDGDLWQSPRVLAFKRAVAIINKYAGG